MKPELTLPSFYRLTNDHSPIPGCPLLLLNPRPPPTLRFFWFPRLSPWPHSVFEPIQSKTISHFTFLVAPEQLLLFDYHPLICLISLRKLLFISHFSGCDCFPGHANRYVPGSSLTHPWTPQQISLPCPSQESSNSFSPSTDRQLTVVILPVPMPPRSSARSLPQTVVSLACHDFSAPLRRAS